MHYSALYIVQKFHVAGNHPSQIFPIGYEPGTALFHHDRDGSLTEYRISVVRKPHSGGQRKSCERYGQPEVPGVLSRLRASVDWLGGRIQGNDTYSSTTGRIVEVQRGRQQAPGYVARGSGIRGRSHISDTGLDLVNTADFSLVSLQPYKLVYRRSHSIEELRTFTTYYYY